MNNPSARSMFSTIGATYCLKAFATLTTSRGVEIYSAHQQLKARSRRAAGSGAMLARFVSALTSFPSQDFRSKIIGTGILNDACTNFSIYAFPSSTPVACSKHLDKFRGSYASMYATFGKSATARTRRRTSTASLGSRRSRSSMKTTTGRGSDRNCSRRRLNRPEFTGERLVQILGCFFMCVQGFIEHLLCFVRRDISDGAVKTLGVVPIDPFQRFPFKLAH